MDNNIQNKIKFCNLEQEQIHPAELATATSVTRIYKYLT